MTIRARGKALLTSATLISLLVSACGREQVAFSDIKTVPRVNPESMLVSCDGSDAPELPTDGATEVVAYPTPAHGSVKPGITGIPLPADAEEVDGFNATFGRDTVIQVFETGLSHGELLKFYSDTMRAHGWSLISISAGPAGVICDFLPYPRSGTDDIEPKNWISVTTNYIPRPGEEPESNELPPGFRGKGVPFAPRTPGKTTFSLLTPR